MKEVKTSIEDSGVLSGNTDISFHNTGFITIHYTSMEDAIEKIKVILLEHEKGITKSTDTINTAILYLTSIT